MAVSSEAKCLRPKKKGQTDKTEKPNATEAGFAARLSGRTQPHLQPAVAAAATEVAPSRSGVGTALAAAAAAAPASSVWP